MSPPAHPPRPRVAFLGPPGTFSEEALLSQPDLAAGEIVPIRSIPEVIAEVDQRRVDLAVVPIENAIEGSVNATLDTLAFDSSGDLVIQREIVIPIDMHLCARPGTRLADVTTVVSIPHATAQCREWLARKLPGVAVAAANSTAEAARDVAEEASAGAAKGNRTAAKAGKAGKAGAAAAERPAGARAAISTALAAKLYGLDILAADIEDHPDNETRFVVLGYGLPARTGHDKTTSVVFQSQDRPGSLLGILQEFDARAVNLTKLESRPTKRGLGNYCFFIDCEGHISDELVADVLRNLAAKHEVRFLGSYPAAGRDSGARRRAAGKAWRAAESWVDDLRSKVRADE
ncbi:MAG TPA: prephenate dehydratase domain-containing protein [Acidimicrobiia bacterium]|nr:prephenate dehydratase domain-containing protein [Acidimicrobiia bacterium]